MKAFFSRKVPFYLMAPEEVTDSRGFDANAVEVPLKAVRYAQKSRRIVETMQEAFRNNAAPEEAAQKEADKFVELIND